MTDISEKELQMMAKNFAKEEVSTARYVGKDPLNPYDAAWFTKRWTETYIRIANDILQTHRIVIREN